MHRYLFAVFLLLAFTVHAQRKLSGKVTASDTKKAVAGANVYLSSTSIGTVTNEKGEFNLDHVPTGKFDLIVSFIGYDAAMVKIEPGASPGALEIILKPKINELDEVVVRSYDKNGWDKWGQLFLDNFMGTSSFSTDCILQNKEVLRFHLNKKTNVVSVFADERLEIENTALGYNLKYDLSGFEYSLVSRDFYYGGYPFFEEMVTDKPRIQKRWEENRQTAYHGSMMHFMRSVYFDHLLEEKFLVHKMLMVSDDEIKRVKLVSKKLSKKPVETHTVITDSKGKELVFYTKDPRPDTTEYYRKVMELPVAGWIVMNQLLTADSISTMVEEDSSRHFTFDHKLYVIYSPKKNPPEYQRYVSRGLLYQPVVSQLSLMDDKEVKVLPNGSYFDGVNLVTSGYWSWWEKMCNKLPYDFVPSPRK
jgi:hypothetical protein